MKKILCPTDFSSTASNAIAYAAKLARKMGANLTLLNVRSLAELTPEEALLGEKVNVEAATASLEDQCREVLNVFKVSCYADVETSLASVSKVIGAKAGGHDLVVMGTNGPDDLFQFFLGSNTYQVIKNSAVPVLIVPEGCGYTDIEKIVYAFDYWRSERFPFTQLVKLAKALGSELCVLQVLEESFSAKGEYEMKETQKMIMDLYKDDVAIRFDTIHSAEIVEGMNEYVRQSNADLLALCTEHYSFIQKVFHKSVIKAISKVATYPVFVFHA